MPILKNPLLFGGWRCGVHHFAVFVFYVGLAFPSVYDKGFEMSGSNGRQIPVDVGKQVGLFGEENWLVALHYGVADHGSGYPPFADAGLVAYNHALTSCFNVVNSHCYGINLFGRKDFA